jgi:hypothetical protein
MDVERRKAVGQWGRDLLVSVVIVPGLLAWLQMNPIFWVVGGICALVLLKLWEHGYPIKKSAPPKTAISPAASSPAATKASESSLLMYAAVVAATVTLITVYGRMVDTELQSTDTRGVYVCPKIYNHAELKSLFNSQKPIWEEMGLSVSLDESSDSLEIHVVPNTFTMRFRFGIVTEWILRMRNSNGSLLVAEISTVVWPLNYLFDLKPVKLDSEGQDLSYKVIAMMTGTPERACRLI